MKTKYSGSTGFRSIKTQGDIKVVSIQDLLVFHLLWHNQYRMETGIFGNIYGVKIKYNPLKQIEFTGRGLYYINTDSGNHITLYEDRSSPVDFYSRGYLGQGFEGSMVCKISVLESFDLGLKCILDIRNNKPFKDVAALIYSLYFNLSI